MKKSHGKVSTRSRLLRSRRKKGIVGILKEFKIGERVIIGIQPRFAEGMPHLRFNGRIGVIAGKQGKASVIKVRDIGKEKTLIVSNIHLRGVIVK